MRHNKGISTTQKYNFEQITTYLITKVHGMFPMTT